MAGVFFRPVYFPTKRILVSDGGTACGVDIVFPYSSATDNGFNGIGGGIGL